MKQIYTEQAGTYLENNPSWHIEDSPWKADQITNMIRKNNLQPKSIVEIGCGAGEILNQLHEKLPDSVHFHGYEIAPDAYEMCLKRKKPRLDFYFENLLELEVQYDLLLMIDVFEHVESYYDFIRKSATKATYKIYHIPLDLTVSGIWRNKLMYVRDKVGHIQYFSKDTALATLRDTGQEIVDYFYTPGSAHSNQKLRTKLLNIPRQLLYQMDNDFAVRLLGGYSLLVLTK